MTKHLLGRGSTGVLPRKCDIANGGSVAVDAYEAEAEGDLGHPWAPSLYQEVNKDQAEDGEQGEDSPVLRAGKTKTDYQKHASWWCFDCSRPHFTRATRPALKFSSLWRALHARHILQQEFKERQSSNAPWIWSHIKVKFHHRWETGSQWTRQRYTDTVYLALSSIKATVEHGLMPPPRSHYPGSALAGRMKGQPWIGKGQKCTSLFYSVMHVKEQIIVPRLVQLAEY